MSQWGLNTKKYLGCVGDVGVVSYDYGKTITTGEGGMIFTNNKKFLNIVGNIMTMDMSSLKIS